MTKGRTCLCAAPLVALVLTEARAQTTFAPLGDLPGGTFGSIANGISADGSVVVGQGVSASGPQADGDGRGDGRGTRTLPTPASIPAARPRRGLPSFPNRRRSCY